VYLPTAERIPADVPNAAAAPRLSQPNKLAARTENTRQCYILTGNFHWTDSSVQSLSYHLSAVLEALNTISKLAN